MSFDNETGCSQDATSAEVAVVHGVHDHWHGQAGVSNEFEKEEAVTIRHTDIDECDINAMSAKLFESLAPIRGFGGDGDIGAVEYQAQTVANEFVVIRN